MLCVHLDRNGGMHSFFCVVLKLAMKAKAGYYKKELLACLSIVSV